MLAEMEITKGERKMYVVYVSNNGSQVSEFESIFTGDDDRYPTLKSGIDAAKTWISESKDRKGYEVKYRIIGCL